MLRAHLQWNGVLHKGMLHKFFYGRNDHVWNVTEHAIDFARWELRDA